MARCCGEEVEMDYYLLGNRTQNLIDNIKSKPPVSNANVEQQSECRESYSNCLVNVPTAKYISLNTAGQLASVCDKNAPSKVCMEKKKRKKLK